MIAAVLLALVAAMYVPHLKNADEIGENDDVERLQPVGPIFNPDSAYSYIVKQCDFGARTMNSEAHRKCGEWLVRMFKQYGCDVETQDATLKGYDGTALQSTNIIARYNPTATTRVLLCAHWDTRPWADNDPDSTLWRNPVMGANDGASGVAVMLEIARLLQLDKTLKLGIDFVAFDAEDWGTPRWVFVENDSETWALGAQHFAKTTTYRDYRYGILLDMVGGEGAQFYQEIYSKQMAPEIVKKIWRAARRAGYGSWFPKQDGGMITDDHVPLNDIAQIPTVDIISYYPNCMQSSFGPTWHTVSDTPDHIDKQALKAVGQTVIQTLYMEALTEE